MKPGVYIVEIIDKRTALLKPLKEGSEQYTFPVNEFNHDISAGDTVEIWLEGTQWRTKYLEKETKSVKSHLRDFKNRLFEED